MALALWVGSPASYTKGRTRPVQYVTLHYTAGSEGPRSAEDGARYDKTRSDGTSCHYFSDSFGPPLWEVGEGDRAHTALWRGNELGVHIEICGTRQTRSQWLDGVSLATLKTTALLVADICKRHGFPLRRLSVAETRAAWFNPVGKRPSGINDHNTITKAYPEDAGDHTDVGEAFPWDVFMAMVTATTGGDGDDMYSEEDRQIAWATTHRSLAALKGTDAVYTVAGEERREVNRVAAQLARAEASNVALTAVAAGLAKAVAAIGTASPEVALLLADVQRRLDAQTELLAAEMRDTTAAALEGGAAGVHARHGPAVP